MLPARVQGFRPADLDALTASGDSSGSAPGARGRRRTRHAAVPRPGRGTGPGAWRAAGRRDARRDPGLLADRGASFWPELVRPRARPIRSCCRVLWDLVWAGEVTNDSLAPYGRSRVRVGGHRGRPPDRGPARCVSRGRRRAPGAGARRRSHVRRPTRPSGPSRVPSAARSIRRRDPRSCPRRGHARRVRRRLPGARAMEESGVARRGYFVAGLGAAQFAMPERSIGFVRPASRRGPADACRGRPGAPYGASLPWPDPRAAPPARPVPSSWCRRRTRGLPRARRQHARHLPRRRPGDWAVARRWSRTAGCADRAPQIDGAPAREIAVEAFHEAGFIDGYYGPTLRGPRQKHHQVWQKGKDHRHGARPRPWPTTSAARRGAAPAPRAGRRAAGRWHRRARPGPVSGRRAARHRAPCTGAAARRATSSTKRRDGDARSRSLPGWCQPHNGSSGANA